MIRIICTKHQVTAKLPKYTTLTSCFVRFGLFPALKSYQNNPLDQLHRSNPFAQFFLDIKIMAIFHEVYLVRNLKLTKIGFFN